MMTFDPNLKSILEAAAYDLVEVPGILIKNFRQFPLLLPNKE
jgi:hypothetical protein